MSDFWDAVHRLAAMRDKIPRERRDGGTMRAIFVKRKRGCLACPFWSENLDGEDVCGARPHSEFPDDLDVGDRPDWCPLTSESQIMVALEPEK